MTTMQQDVARPRPKSTWKWLGLACMAPAVLIFGLFAFAEGLGGEEGWWGHLIQLAIAVAVVLGAWFFPKVFGPLVVLLGITPIVAMLVNGAPVGVVSSSTMLVWLPLLLSGVCFTLAGYRRDRSAGPPSTEVRGS